MSGGTVFAGGKLVGYIGGQYRGYMVALDAVTGNATSWNASADNVIATLAVSGDTLYAGGWFNNIGRQPRSGLAALDVATGDATAWHPASLKVPTITLAVTPDRVYAWGTSGLVRFDGQTDPEP